MAGGGTAGHLQPALAIAEALVDAGPRPVAPSSSSGPNEARTRPPWPGGASRSRCCPAGASSAAWRPRDLARNVRSAWELVVAAGRAVRLVGRARPRVVVAVGGYASLAGSVGALVHRVPLVLVNVDAVPGAANRLLGQVRRRPARWGGRAHPLPRAVVTGTPVRPEIAAVDRDPGGPARRPGPPSASPTDRPGGGGVRRLARGPPDQPGGRRHGRAVGRPGRRGDLPHRRPAGLGRLRRADPAAERAPAASDGERRAGRTRRARTWCACPTRSGCPPSTPPPTWWCAGPGP